MRACARAARAAAAVLLPLSAVAEAPSPIGPVAAPPAAIAEPEAATAPGPAFSEGGFLSLTFENDIFGGDDRYYTNGLRLSYTSGRNQLPLWGRIARRNLGWLTDAQDWYVAYAVGQNIYTGTDIADPNPPPDDRPYAGFLYGSLAIFADRGDRLDTLALDVGMVGPSSLARETQTLVHDIFGFQDPKGWGFQLKDEPAFRLLYERKRRFLASEEEGLPFGLEIDAAPHYSVALGTIDTSAAAGLTLRIGDNLRADYGPPRVRPAVSGPAFFGDGTGGFSWSMFASAEARAVGRNLFLEGNTFRDSRSVDIHRIVGDFSVGFGLQWNGVELNYTQVIRTPEYVGQTGPAIFGSVNLRMRF